MNSAPASKLRRALADSNVTSIVAGALLVVAGFATIGVTWTAVAARLDVPLQLPYLVSGGFAGLGLIASGIVLVNVQVARRVNAVRRDQLDAVLRQTAELSAQLRRGGSPNGHANFGTERATEVPAEHDQYQR